MCQFVILFATIGLMIAALDQAPIMAEAIRGHNMESATIPFVVSIAVKTKNELESRLHHSSGALIAEDLVLTAAHCIKRYKYDTMNVVLGFADLKYTKPRYEVYSWITFKEWANDKYPNSIGDEPGDIALIKLKRRVRGVIPANITTLRVEDLYGKNATLVGRAAEKNGKPRFLETAKVQILTPIECEQRTQLDSNKLNWVPGGVICTAADPCTLLTPGDSGGPLLDGSKVILAINKAVCVGKLNSTEKFIDEHQFNMHTYFLDKYRRFIDEMKAVWSHMGGGQKI